MLRTKTILHRLHYHNYSLLLQNIVVYYQKIIFYHNASNSTTECSNSMDYTPTNDSILLQNMVVYYEKIIFTTTCDILQQCVIFTTERGNSH